MTLKTMFLSETRGIVARESTSSKGQYVTVEALDRSSDPTAFRALVKDTYRVGDHVVVSGVYRKDESDKKKAATYYHRANGEEATYVDLTESVVRRDVPPNVADAAEKLTGLLDQMRSGKIPVTPRSLRVAMVMAAELVGELNEVVPENFPTAAVELTAISLGL